MAFCKYCGKQNNETTKFCIGCGKPLSVAVQTQQPTPAVAPYPQYTAPQKSNKTLFLILGIVGVLGLGTLVYFLAIKPKENTNSKNVQVDTAKVTTITEMPAPTQTTVTNETTQSSESVTAEQHVRNYFDVTTTKIFDNIYPYLINCRRYYSDYNPTRESIYKAATAYWSKVTDITQTINYVNVESIGNGKNALVNMDYSFFSIKDQQQKYITNLSLRVLLDNNNNIIEIYELSRDK